MNRFFTHHSARGFTLIEVVLYIAIATGVVVAVFGLLQITFSSRTRYFAEAQVVQQATWANQRFIDLVNGTTDITSPGPGQTSSVLIFGDGSMLSNISGAFTLTLADASTQALTSAVVHVASVSFARTVTVGQADSIHMELTMGASASRGTSLNEPVNHVYTSSASPLR